MPIVATPAGNLAANNLCGMKLHVGPVAFGFGDLWISVLRDAVKNDPGGEGEPECQS